jgi:hypothetical protein
MGSGSLPLSRLPVSPDQSDAADPVTHSADLLHNKSNQPLLAALRLHAGYPSYLGRLEQVALVGVIRNLALFL